MKEHISLNAISESEAHLSTEFNKILLKADNNAKLFIHKFEKESVC